MPWIYREKFDFVYSRNMLGSLNDVQKFCYQAFENTVPGGWLEMADMSVPLFINSGELPKDSAHVIWYVCYPP